MTLTRLNAALLLSLFAIAPAKAEVIKTVGGKFDEDLASIASSPEGLVLKTAKRSLRMDLVRTIEFNPASRAVAQASPAFYLTTGDRLRGQLVGGDADAIELRTASLGTVKVPLEKLRAMVRKPTAVDQRWVEKNLRRKGDKDLVYMESGGEAAGVLEALGSAELKLDMEDAGLLKIKLPKVRMLLMSIVEKPEAITGGTLVQLRLLDGSNLSGRLLGLSGESLELACTLSKKLTIRKSDVQELLVLNGAFVYLSDLDPVEVVQRFPEGFEYYPDIYGWKRNRSNMGGVIKLGGKTYEKGLGVHSYCALSYELGGKYKEFRALVGLDDAVRYLGEPDIGSVRLRVILDGKPAKELPDGLLKRKGDTASQISVAVEGVKRLTIVADFGPHLHILGRADWADAHLIRKR